MPQFSREEEQIEKDRLFMGVLAFYEKEYDEDVLLLIFDAIADAGYFSLETFEKATKKMMREERFFSLAAFMSHLGDPEPKWNILNEGEEPPLITRDEARRFAGGEKLKDILKERERNGSN